LPEEFPRVAADEIANAGAREIVEPPIARRIVGQHALRVALAVGRELVRDGRQDGRTVL
jgi:hypothetical protein